MIKPCTAAYIIKNIRVIIILWLFLPGIIWAQTGTLSGSIYEKGSKEPLAFANIIIEGSSKGTYSDVDGRYTIELDTGLTKIRYRFLSYRDTLIQVRILSDTEIIRNIPLKPKMMAMDMTVSADRVARKVQELAKLRDQRNSNLRSYKADIYKLAILSRVNDSLDYERLDQINSDTLADAQQKVRPMAFSERKSRITYTTDPERYTEVLLANRASENFFSEYDFFSTGGEPLNLNADEVNLSILAEGITVVGPISSKAGEFYDLYDEEADSTWPDGTIKIYFKPIVNNRPLFDGKVWYDPDRSVILGVDVKLNDFVNTNSGLFKISDFRYQQSYRKVGDFWLPKTTQLSAFLEFITSKEPIYYHDEWTWDNYQVNEPSITQEEVVLNTGIIMPDAHKKEETYWEGISNRKDNENFKWLKQAKTYKEDRELLKAGMSALSAFHRLPFQLERSYLTNFSDFYRYNRVEGHYAGIGLRTPVHPDYSYKVIAGYGFGSTSLSYKFSFHQYLGSTILAPEFSYFKQALPQYQDYEYNRTPLDFFNTRQTLTALLAGTSGNNYFERKGLEGGLRFRLGADSFFRVLYMKEEHGILESTSSVNLTGNDLTMEERLNNDPIYPAQEGSVNGWYLHLHHDTRKYSRNQFLRNYNIREFGWLTDMVWEMGLNRMGSDFQYHRYRLGMKFYWPVFSTHFFQTDIIVGAANSGTPHQRLFTYNGFVVDDYVRYRPFNTLSYKNPIGYRVSQLRFRYKFGSSITRIIPIEFISKSGIQISTLFNIGLIDQKNDLSPLIPSSDMEAQSEVGIAASKILGIFYAEFSKKIYGSFGNSVGFKLLF